MSFIKILWNDKMQKVGKFKGFTKKVEKKTKPMSGFEIRYFPAYVIMLSGYKSVQSANFIKFPCDMQLHF